MWPVLLDMTKEECIQNLRHLELEAYSQLVSALRAQGPLSVDKRKLLKDTGQLLNITPERHKAEIRRAINDEKLNTIAYHVTGHTETSEDWAKEGRRLVPLLPRTAPQTAFSALADEIAETASQCNKQIPTTSTNTERKRPTVPSIPIVPETSKSIPFRIPEPPKSEENKKRKLPPENSSLAQHLLAPKVCRIQQLYRQRSKAKPKEIKKEPDQLDIIQPHRMIQAIPQQTTLSSSQAQLINQKINVLQNISLIKEETLEQEHEASCSTKPTELVQSTSGSNENPVTPQKIISNVKSNSNITIKQTQLTGLNSETPKTIKVCSTKKPITKTVNAGQKLIVVSNAQTVPTNSILQRTLQIPFVKNVSIKNLEKFKIVTSNSSPTSITVANVSNSGSNSVKHKIVTVKTNPTTKKIIPLSQLQVLNSKGSIKVLPIGSKIVGKTVGTSSPLYIVNTTQQLTKSTPVNQTVTTSKIQTNEETKSSVLENITELGIRNTDSNKEVGKSVLADILKASGVIPEENSEEYNPDKIEKYPVQKEVLDNENDKARIKIEDVEEKINSEDVHDYVMRDIKEEGVNIKEEVLIKTEEIMNEIIESENLNKHDKITDFEHENAVSGVNSEIQVVTEVDNMKLNDIEFN